MASRKRKPKPRRKARKTTTNESAPKLELPTVGAEAIAEILAVAPPPPAESDPLPLEGAEYRHELFAQRYTTHGNATVAAVESGYSADCAGVQGSRLLRDAKVRRRIHELQSEAIARNGQNRDRIIQELAAVGFSDPADLFMNGDDGVPRIRPVEDWSPPVRRSIKSIKTKFYPAKYNDDELLEAEHYVMEFQFWDKTTALVKLGENMGMFAKTVRVKHSLDEAAKELQQILNRGVMRKQEREVLLAGNIANNPMPALPS